MNSIQISQWCIRLWFLLFLGLLGGYGLNAQAAGPEPAGWYAGDMHVHRSCGGSPEAVSSLYNKMSTHDLAVISLLADMGNGEVQNPVTDLPRVTGQDDPISTSGRIVHWDAEWHWDATYGQYAHQALGGHLVALGLTEAHQIWEEYTSPIFNWAHQQNGIAGFAHMQYLGSGIPQSLNCCIPIEYPVEVALGAADFISEDVTGSDTAIQAYYRLLNTGFRPGLAAGTDYPCGVSELGSLLTYVQVAGGQMTYRNWIEGIKLGRTVISRNGHNEFLDLKVNSTATPGDEIRLTGSGSVQVTIQWTANQNLTGTIELVRNGVVVASQQASVTASVPANLTTTVNFTKSGWLAARRMNSNGHQVHTAAVFVMVNNAPIRASAADAEFYVQWMDNLLEKTSPGGEWNSYFPTSLSAAQARYQWAKAIYQQIALEAGATPQPLVITTTSPLPEGIVNVAYSATLTASGGIPPYTWSITSGSLPPSLTLNSGTITGTSNTVGTYSFTVQVSDASNPGQTATKPFSITIAATPTGVTIWPSTAVPGTADSGPDSAVELGVKFRSDIAGTITGIRFYKGSGNTGTHVGNLWTSSGTLLASATFTGETASGWQQVLFSTPVAVTANTIYVASYHTDVGHYSENQNYFETTGVDSPPLHALANGVSGGNGVYVYGSASAFPNQTWNSTHYWVDVVFSSGPQPVSIATTSLPGGTVGVAYSATLVASGGSTPSTWSIISGSLPGGLTLNTSSGAISGTPTTPTGTFNFTAQVTDSSGGTASRSLSIVIAQPITNTGFLAPSANAAVTSSAGDNNGFQTGPANAYADDGLFAVDTDSGTGTSTSCTANGKDKHVYRDYSFGLPGGATIQGIEVRLDAKVDNTANAPKTCVQLSSNGGTSWTVAKTTATLSTTEATYILGSAADTWGRTWASANFSNANFRVRVINVASSTARDFSLDWVAVRVTYQ